VEELSQEEIELLMSGMLTDEKSKEILETTKKENLKEEDRRLEEESIKNIETIDEKPLNEVKEPEVISKADEKNEGTEDNPKVPKKQFVEILKNQVISLKNALKGNSKKRANGLKSLESNNALVKVVKVLTLLVVIMGILFISQLYRKNQLLNAEKITVSVPKYKANATNYIFVAEKKRFKDNTLELVKMLIDPVATVFYFDKPMDFTLYEASLKDKNGKNYNMDLSFAQTNNVEGNKLNYARFEPLDKGIKEFTLSISDPSTGESVDYRIVLKSSPKVLAAKSIPQPLITKDSNEDMQVVLENAVFSGAGTSIEYRLNWKDNAQTLQSGWQNVKPTELVNVKSSGTTLSQTRAYPAMYSFTNDNTVLGRIDFDNVKNLNSKVDIVFKNLYRQKTLSEKIDLERTLFNENNYKYINLGQYILVIERFGDYGNKCGVVYHVEDATSKTRVEAKLVAELVISDQSGMQVVTKGECTTKKENAELLFDIEKNKDVLDKLVNKKYTLNLTNIGVKFPDQSLAIDLSKLDDAVIQEDKVNVKQFVMEAFKKRLSVKSGEVDKNELERYFEDYILKEEAIVRDYFQPVTLIEPAEYSSQIITMGKKDDGMYYAVVQDSWKGNEGIKEVHFYRTHKVIVQNTNGEFKITEDITIK
jgi:hypothetical protein